MDRLKYKQDALKSVAPWVADEIAALKMEIEQDMEFELAEWIHLVEKNHSELWRSIDAQG